MSAPHPQHPAVIIVGAGPAGLGAAQELVAQGLRPILLEEAAQPGGQGTRRLAAAMAGKRAALFGRAARRMQQREEAEDRILAQCDYRPGTLVWGLYDGVAEILGPQGYDSLSHDRLLIAVGATDRLLPVPGWTLPGVFTLGGAQVALKRHASLIGRNVVFAGTSPLLYLAAAQYLRLGCGRVTILDTTPFAAKLRALPAMARHAPRSTFEGIALLAELRRAGVLIAAGVRVDAIRGDAQVRAVEYRDAKGRHQLIDCDAVALGFGLRPETQLAELAGAEFSYDTLHRHWFARSDDMGRVTETVWIAGDGARTGGAVAADAAGRLAALSILESLDRLPNRAGIPALKRRLSAQRRFQDAMTRAFQWPADHLRDLADDTILCRCERVTIGAVRAAIAAPLGPGDVNRVKSVTRCAMGRCQGRFCGPALAEVSAQCSGVDGAGAGRLRAQAPVRPIPVCPVAMAHCAPEVSE